IAVHLQISKTSAKEIQSAFSVLGRSVELVIADTEIRGMEGADLIVGANVEAYTSLDYEKSDELIQIGYGAAEAKAGILQTYALDDAAWAEYMSKKQSRLRTTIGTPQFMKIEGATTAEAQNIRQFLSPLVGKPLVTADVDHLLTRLTGVGRYDSVTYGMLQEDGRSGLLIHVHEKSYAPPLLQPSFAVDGTQTDDVTFTLGARLTFMDVAGFRSEWRTDLRVGATYGIQSELYRPLRPFSRWFVAPFLNASESTFRFYHKSDPRADYRMDSVLAGADFGYGFNRFNELRAGYGAGYSDVTLRLGTPEFVAANGLVRTLRARYVFDHINEPVIPTRGVFIQSDFHRFDAFPGSTEPVPVLETTVQYFQPVSERSSLFLIASGGSTFGVRHTGIPPFFLGGPGRLSAYGLRELTGNQYGLARAGYLHRVFALPNFVGNRVYLYAEGEAGKMYGDPHPNIPRFSTDVAMGLLAETAFGPVFVGGSVGDTGHQKWYFQLGRVF
ncbi:MAG TPA: BamA/TamA family outer membrane protein, partial [Candidatus Acidoferrum sp.]